MGLWIQICQFCQFFYQNLLQDMARKIKHDQYEVIISFKTDNCLSITAEFLPTNEHFSNNSIELMRINKDTVVAALEKKSEKHLRCEFEQVVADGKKTLQITFVVNFDFLPEFRQQISLDYIEFKDSIKKLSLASMQAEIDEMGRALDSFETNGATTHTELPTTYANSDKKEVWSLKVNEGKYILRASGTVMNSVAAGYPDTLKFLISAPGEAEIQEKVVKAHNMQSYHYPFFFSEVVSCSSGDLKVQMTSTMSNATVMNLHFVVNRVLEVN